MYKNIQQMYSSGATQNMFLGIYRPRIINYNMLRLDTYYFFIISKEYVNCKVPTYNNKRSLA